MKAKRDRRTDLHLVAALGILAVFLSGCSLWPFGGEKRANRVQESAAQTDSAYSRVYPVSFTPVFDQSRRVFDELDWQVVSSDAGNGSLVAYPGLHVLMWGKKFVVTVERVSDENTRVSAQYGGNEGSKETTKLRGFFDRLDRRVAALSSAGESQAARAESKPVSRTSISSGKTAAPIVNTSPIQSKPISIDRSVRDTAFKAGKTNFEQGDYASALNSFKKAFDADPAFSEALYNVAVCHFYLQNYTEAEESFNFFIQLKPDDAEAHYFRGVCRYKKGNVEGAIADWQETIRLNPNHTAAGKNLSALGAQ